jgi:hypothetical protein
VSSTPSSIDALHTGANFTFSRAETFAQTMPSATATAFERWCAKNGVKWNERVWSVRVDEATGNRSVRCESDWSLKNADREEEEALCRIPKRSCFTIETSALGSSSRDALETLRALGVPGLIAAVAHERGLIRGEVEALDGEPPAGSRFAEYFNFIPEFERLPNTWTEEDGVGLFKGTKIAEMLVEDEAAMREDYDEVREALGGAGNRPSDSFEAFRNAATLVASRAFFVDDSVGQGLLPFADLFNHKSDGAHFRLVGDGKEDDAEEELLLRGCRDMRAGEEMFNSFGDDHDNHVLLYKYGFAELENVVRCVEFPGSFFRSREEPVLEGLYAHAFESYDGLSFEIDDDGCMSRELIILIRVAHGVELGEYGPGKDGESVSKPALDAMDDLLAEDGADEAELLAEIDPNRIVSLFRRRMEAYYEPIERASVPLEPAELAREFALKIQSCYALVEEASERARDGDHPKDCVVGKAAAHLIRAQELELLLKGYLRALGIDGGPLGDEEEEEEEEEDVEEDAEPAKRKAVLIAATPCYAPTVYLKKPKNA